MVRVPHEKRPPAVGSDQRGSEEDELSIADCDLCRRRPRAHGWEWCHRCLRDTVAGIRRRRAAASRMPRLECGRRDPLDVDGIEGGRRDPLPDLDDVEEVA